MKKKPSTNRRWPCQESNLGVSELKQNRRDIHYATGPVPEFRKYSNAFKFYACALTLVDLFMYFLNNFKMYICKTRMRIEVNIILLVCHKIISKSSEINFRNIYKGILYFL